MFTGVTHSEINFQITPLKFDLNCKPEFSAKTPSNTGNRRIARKPVSP